MTSRDTRTFSVLGMLAQVGRLISLFDALLVGRRFVFVALVFLSLAGAVLDGVGIALVMPLVAAIQGPSTNSAPGLEALSAWFETPVVSIAAIVACVYLAKNIIALLRIHGTLVFLFGLWESWVEKIVHNLLEQPVAITEGRKPGALLSIALSQSAESVIGLRQLMELGVSGFTLLCTYVVLWLVSWQATLGLTVLFVPFALIGLRMVSQRSHAAGANLVRFNELSSSVFLEIVGGLRYVKAFGQEERFEGRIRDGLAEMRRSYVSALWMKGLIHPLIETTIVLVFCIAIIVATGGPNIDVSRFLPVLGVFAAAAFRLFPVFSGLGGQWVLFISKQAAVESVLELMKEPSAESTGSQPFAGLRRAVDFRAVSYTYPGRLPAVIDVSFTIEKGRQTALVGESGSGKSTVAALLLGFLKPAQGDILVDQVPLVDLSLSTWRSAIGYVGQDGFIFNASIGENITLGRVAETDPRVAEVADVVGLDAFVRGLPHGYDTPVGERGLELSGGQRQRVSLARALLGRPEILILDEATSALDNESAARVLEALHAFLPQGTVVTVSHRLQHTVRYDSILVLREGRVVERGTHEELMKLGGYYHQLFDRETVIQKTAP